MTQPSHVYSSVSILLHWVIAVLVIGQIGTVMAMDAASDDMRPLWSMLHKSGGMAILMLTLVRIAWRFREPWKPLPVQMPSWQKVIARISHVGFYAVLLAMPLLGWAASSAAGRGFEFYGLFDWPLLPVGGGRETARGLMDIHSLGAKVLYVLLFLHIAGALKHQFLDRDNELRKMLPFLPDRGFADPRGPHGAP